MSSLYRFSKASTLENDIPILRSSNYQFNEENDQNRTRSKDTTLQWIVDPSTGQEKFRIRINIEGFKSDEVMMIIFYFLYSIIEKTFRSTHMLIIINYSSTVNVSRIKFKYEICFLWLYYSSLINHFRVYQKSYFKHRMTCLSILIHSGNLVFDLFGCALKTCQFSFKCTCHLSFINHYAS